MAEEICSECLGLLWWMPLETTAVMLALVGEEMSRESAHAASSSLAPYESECLSVALADL